MNDPLSKIKLKLVIASMGSCTCCTKTPDTEHHKETCRYRLLVECYELLEELK